MLCTSQVYGASNPDSNTSSDPQQRVVTGIVKDLQGNPLAGVNIVEKGTISGVVTTADGRYSINVSSANAILVYSFIGYTRQEIPVGSQTSINVTLLENIAGLEEVVVVGYGTQKKVNLTGALATVSSAKLEMRPIVSTAQGLQGLIPNLNITFRDGNPAGGGVDFNIRGYESINGGSPLILVDGVPMDLQLINPSDIQSLTVLKDAAASAIYGARASYGVILVTTKQGAKKVEDKMTVQYNYESSISQPIMYLDIVDNSYTFALWKNKSAVRADGTALYDDRFVSAVKAYYDDPKNNPEWGVYNGILEFYGYNNWKDILVKDFSPSQKHNLSISGATKNSNYYVSFGYLNKDGFLKIGNDNFKRYNILMRSDYKLKDWLTLDEKIMFNLKKTNGPTGLTGDFNTSIVRPIPLIPTKFPKLAGYESLEGMNIWINSNTFGLNSGLAQYEGGGREKTSNSDIWLTSGITLNPIKDFIIRAEYSKNFNFSEYEAVQNSIAWANAILSASATIINDPPQGNTYITNSIDKTNYNVFNTYGEYTLNAGSHYIKAMVGFNQEWLQINSLGGTAYGILASNLPDISLTNGKQLTSGGRSELALRGAFYRLNYIYKDRYLFEADGRYDGTSRFPKNDRFAFFPSFSVGWRISNEKFMEPIKGYLDNLKIRASYGTLGNQQISGYYPYIASMGVGLSSWIFNSSGQSPRVSVPGLVSSTLTWETVTSKNMGLDIGLFKGKLDGSFDIYSRATKGMLMNASYPAVLGAAAPKINGADLKTVGWELSLSWRDKITNDMSYDVTFSLADNHAEITKYNNPTGSLTDYYEGQQIGEIWGYETVGIYQDSTEVTSSADQSLFGSFWRPGDIHYADLDENGVVNPGKNTITDHGDRKIIANSTSRYLYGVNLNLHYKNWSLNTFFQGVAKKTIWPNMGGNGAFIPFGANTSFENWMIDESWSTTNRNAYFWYPNRYPDQNAQVQTRYLQNAAYLRCKNVTLGYTFNQNVIKKIGISDMQIYLSGQNLFALSKIHRPFDPEMTATNSLEYPFQRTYCVGVNVSF